MCIYIFGGECVCVCVCVCAYLCLLAQRNEQNEKKIMYAIFEQKITKAKLAKNGKHNIKYTFNANDVSMYNITDFINMFTIRHYVSDERNSTIYTFLLLTFIIRSTYKKNSNSNNNNRRRKNILTRYHLLPWCIVVYVVLVKVIVKIW